MAKFVRLLSLSILVLFFSGCLPKKEDVKSVFQTNSANVVKNDYKEFQKLLSKFKSKLDKRNPKAYSKKYEKSIYSLLNSNHGFLLKHNNNLLENYKEYLQLAFSKDKIQNRNDFLILGIYYLMYESYEVEDGHKIAAFEYDKNRLQKMHKNLQILKWKIKVDKDIKGKYLFLTWQNNWQIELEEKLQKGEKLSSEELQKLEFIKNNKESVLDPSNFSFEVILTQMLDRVENSLRALGEEPKELSVSALRGLFLFF